MTSLQATWHRSVWGRRHSIRGVHDDTFDVTNRLALTGALASTSPTLTLTDELGNTPLLTERMTTAIQSDGRCGTYKLTPNLTV